MLQDSGNRRKKLAVEFEESIEPIAHTEGMEFLVLKNLKSLVCSCIADIQEWTIQDYYRTRAISILIHLTSIARAHITPHLQEIIRSCIRACGQSDDPEYIALFHDCFSQIGQHCEYELLLSLFKNHMLSELNSPSERSLSLELLSTVITVSPTLNLDLTVEIATSMNLASSEHTKILKSTHDLVQKFILTIREQAQIYAVELFYALLLLESSAVRLSAEKTMEILAECCGLLSAAELYALQLPTALPTVISNYKYWDANSTNRKWFRTLVIKASGKCREFFSTILDVISHNCARERDSEVRFDMLVVTEHLIQLDDLADLVKAKAAVILNEVIAPTGAWKVGASSMQVRIASMVCLDKLLSKLLVTGNSLLEAWGKLFPVLKTCSDDDWEPELRAWALSCISYIVAFYMDFLEEIQVLDIYPELLKRLDDSQDHIRIQAAECFKMYFAQFPDRIGRFGNYKFVLSTLFVQMDDPNEKIQKAIRGVLEIAMSHNKTEFLEIANEASQRHRHPREVSELIELAKV